MVFIMSKKDKELIEKFGGATVLAERLGYSVQRVQNWKTRGIPSKVKLDNPELFLKKTSPTKNNNQQNV